MSQPKKFYKICASKDGQCYWYSPTAVQKFAKQANHGKVYGDPNFAKAGAEQAEHVAKLKGFTDIRVLIYEVLGCGVAIDWPEGAHLIK